MNRAVYMASVLMLTCCGSPKEQKCAFDVEGMHCNGCVEAITAEVGEVSGVTSVTVSLDGHRADVTLRAPADAAQVESAIEKLGYKATPIAADSAK